jgi:hypothetical protein
VSSTENNSEEIQLRINQLQWLLDDLSSSIKSLPICSMLQSLPNKVSIFISMHPGTCVMETVCIIHQLARSGGTLLNRCLGCMPGILMLSEIHPNMGNRLDQFHALVQAQQWFGIFSDSDIESIKQHKDSQDYQRSLELLGYNETPAQQ